MKISKIKLSDFKFYHQQEIEINENNMLLYGENGSGKSSLYWALYVFYKSIFSFYSVKYINYLNSSQPNNLVNHNSNANEAIIEVICEGQEIKISATSYIVPSNFIGNSSKTIHFINHEKLSNFFGKDINQSNNFYETIKNEFLEDYLIFDDLKIILLSINSTQIDSTNVGSFTFELNNELKKVLKKIKRMLNGALKLFFEESLLIEFIIIDPFRFDQTAGGSWNLQLPIINVKVNNHTDFILRLNEAMVKLISIAFYFSLILYNKKKVQQDNLLKLLVLDDFLLSLDMGQRGKVLEFIFDHFLGEYQLFIITHDLVFYDLVKRKISHYNNRSEWIFKNIYSHETTNGYFEPVINTRDDDYLTKAENFLNSNQLEECGNNLRKEIEKILFDMMIQFETGKKGTLYSVIEVFRNQSTNKIYEHPQKVIENFENNSQIVNILNSAMNNVDKENTIKKLLLSSSGINVASLKKILHDIQWHRDIVGNATSHHSMNDLYKKEFKQAIKDIKKLKLFIENT